MKALIIFLAIWLAFSFWACQRDDDFITDPAAKLEFSLDTLRFDTVFTELGSATRILKVYNRNNRPIQIAHISIASGAASKFRLNVDGLPGNEAKNIEIAAEDSLYIFGEVTINPDEPLSVSPFVLTDELIFETNGNVQKVVLEAWGQNANYIPSRFSKGGIALLSCDFNEVVWDDPKPYVIYGVLVIDSCTLRLPAGAKVYVHGGVAQTFDENENLIIYNDGLIYALPNGRIQIEGTLDNPVVVQGDRLEEDFSEIAGQWVGLRLESTGNLIEHAVIKNSIVGVLVDSAAELTIRNSRIFNTSGPGIFGQHAQITGSNCLVYNNGSRSVQLTYGGTYDFTYCTFASYGVDAPALSLSNGICYDLLCSQFDIFPLSATFTNSIIYGSRSDEISLSDFTLGMNPQAFDIDFDHCIVRVQDLLDPDEGGYPDFLQTQCATCLNVTPADPLFYDPNDDDYHLDTLSVAERFARPVSLTLDLEGNERDPDEPDAGCFEYQYE